jgi:hypothetical protein
MAAVSSYATLTTEIARVMERTYVSAETDGFIANAESEIRVELGPHFAKETAGATLTVTAGSATLPTGLVRVLSLLHTTYGQLTEMSIATIRERRIGGSTTVPTGYCLTGTTILTDALYTGNLTLDYEGTLPALTSINTTNWLVTYAPMVYLEMCLYYAFKDEEDVKNAALHKSIAMNMLKGLNEQSLVMQLGRASVTIPGVTP